MYREQAKRVRRARYNWWWLVAIGIVVADVAVFTLSAVAVGGEPYGTFYRGLFGVTVIASGLPLFFMLSAAVAYLGMRLYSAVERLILKLRVPFRVVEEEVE